MSLALIVMATGASLGNSQCAGATSVPSHCSQGLGSVLMENRGATCAIISFHNAETGETVETPEICPVEDTEHGTRIPSRLLPLGHYEVAAVDASTGAAIFTTAAELDVTCGGGTLLVVDGTMAPPTPELPPEITEEAGQELLERISGLGEVPHIDACWREPTTEEDGITPFEPSHHFWAYNEFSHVPFMNQVLANQAYINDYLGSIFPELMEAAGGAAVIATVVNVPTLTYRDADGRLILDVMADIKYTVAPQFQFLNNGLESAGAIRVQKKLYDWADSPTGELGINRFYAHHTQVNPSSGSGYGYGFLAQEVQADSTMDLSTWGYENLDYALYEGSVGTGIEYRVKAVKAECHEEGQWMQLQYQARLRLNNGNRAFGSDERYNPFSRAWDTDPIHGDCYLKEMTKSLRGTRDFLRRKMMDLNGGDTFLFEIDSDGYFTLSYNGLYECSRDILVDE